ncbi:MAG: Ig-like domain-containing protein, partial [Coriobacteriales bacterium]|nr:Ig-like domain-containing protein [Coriobacteriales bacterium]
MEVTKFRKRGVLAVVMSLLMVVSMMPVYGAAYAETGSETTVAAVEAEPGATAEVLAADVAAMEAEAEATVTGTAEPGATAEAEAEAEAASAANPDGSAGSLTALALPEISVRVEYTQPEWNLYPGTYPANYDFYPDEGGGEIYINKPNTDPGVVYNVYVTVEGWGETLGKSGSIGEILGRFNVSGQTETPEGIKQLLLGFGVNIGYTSGPTPTEPELYYKVTGRLGDRVYNPEWGWVFRPLTYDPASIRGREPWISAYLLEDQTPLANRVRVETDGSFELYLLKAVIDTLPETEMVEFRSESPYLTHTGALVPANLIKEEGTIELLGEWAGVVTGTISRGHLPADIIYDDTTSYVRIEFTPVNNTSGSEYRAGVFMNAANDPIPFYLSSIPAGEYEVSFVYVEGPSWWSQGAVFQQYAPTPVTVVALEDTEGINTVGWLGDRDHYNIGDIYGPVVVDVNPLGNNQTPTGELAITFNEPIDMAAGGTVRLVGATAHPTYVPLTNGTWSNNAMTYTVAYDGLEAGHVYRVGISDFRDVRRNVMGDDDSRYSLVVQGGEIDRVFEHTDSGISMSGSFTPDAKVNVIQGLAALGASAACNVMREAYEAGLMLSVQDISVEDGRFIGPVTITIPLGWEYNDRTVYVLHCKGGELEKIRATVVNGAVTFQLTSLSPIGIVLPEALNISAANYDFDAETATLTVKTNAGTTEWKNGTNLTPGDIENIVIED